MKSDARRSIPGVIRRIAKSGERYRVEFRNHNSEIWFAYNTIYDNYDEAEKHMKTMDHTDDLLGGDWEVVDPSNEAK